MLQEQAVQKRQPEESPINFREILFTLTNKLWLIIIAGLIGGIIALLYTNLAITPTYRSTSQIYVLDRSHLATATGINASDLNLGAQLTKDFEQILKSRAVGERVRQKLELDMDASAIVGRISVSAVEDTRSMNISVTDTDPLRAQEICNAVAEVSSDYVQTIMDVDSINIIDKATYPSVPFSPNVKKNTLMGVVLGIALAVAFILFRYFTDDAIKQEEDVTRYLGLSVLGSIPLEGVAGGGTYGSYGGYGSYRRYGSYGAYGRYGRYGHIGHPSAQPDPAPNTSNEANEEAQK